MKGAIAELCAKTMSTPRKKRPTNMGASHHFLILQKNVSNSPTVLKRLAAVLTAFRAPIMNLLILYLIAGSLRPKLDPTDLTPVLPFGRDGGCSPRIIRAQSSAFQLPWRLSKD